MGSALSTTADDGCVRTVWDEMLARVRNTKQVLLFSLAAVKSFVVANLFHAWTGWRQVARALPAQHGPATNSILDHGR